MNKLEVIKFAENLNFKIKEDRWSEEDGYIKFTSKNASVTWYKSLSDEINKSILKRFA